MSKDTDIKVEDLVSLTRVFKLGRIAEIPWGIGRRKGNILIYW